VRLPSPQIKRPQTGTQDSAVNRRRLERFRFAGFRLEGALAVNEFGRNSSRLAR